MYGNGWNREVIRNVVGLKNGKALGNLLKYSENIAGSNSLEYDNLAS